MTPANVETTNDNRWASTFRARLVTLALVTLALVTFALVTKLYLVMLLSWQLRCLFLPPRGTRARFVHFFALLLICIPWALADDLTPLPRIGVRMGADDWAEFYNRDTNAAFTPRGFNHTVLRDGWHATFNTGVYDPEAMEATLTRMHTLGANCIRVWIWGKRDATGVTGDPTSEGLHEAYMRNVAGFLRRCTKHELYVIAVMDEVPLNQHYRAVRNAADGEAANDTVSGYSRQYLTACPIAAKAALAADFVRWIRDHDATLLPTVLGWSFANEVFVNTSDSPFQDMDSLAHNATGKVYDMAVEAQRQACYDEGILYWANTLADAVKAVDPDALTTAGMWTADAHGREPVNGLVPETGRDPRIPPRPSVLGGDNCRLDFLDVHIYPWDGTDLVSRTAHERDLLRGTRAAALVGEFGTFKHQHSTEASRPVLESLLGQAHAMGYRGGVHWVWDLTMAPEHPAWSSVEGGLADFVMQLLR